MVLDLAAPPPPCHLATPTIHEQPALLPCHLWRELTQESVPGQISRMPSATPQGTGSGMLMDHPHQPPFPEGASQGVT